MTAADTEHAEPPYTLHHGDCLEVMRSLPDNSVDSVVTDPPYGIRFMGKAWDGADIDARAASRRSMQSHAPDAGPNGGHKSIAAEAGKYDMAPAAMRAFQQFSEDWAREALRVLKPGGHLLSFSAPRTYHRMVCGIEDAGFEIRDSIQWVFGSGFPKSHNLDGEHDGWGTALKPAHEPICVARKPLIGTVAANVAVHGTGAMNIDACRVHSEDAQGYAYTVTRLAPGATQNKSGVTKQAGVEYSGRTKDGRWPANLIHDGSAEVLAAFPDAPGQQGEISNSSSPRAGVNTYGAMRRGSPNKGAVGFNMLPGGRRLDAGSAARFFYCAKASRLDRNEGTGAGGAAAVSTNATMRRIETADWTARNGNHHPTVKPTDLMSYLLRLVTPPGGLALDPFMGSGSTGKAAMREGFRFVGIELDPEYIEIAQARIEHEIGRVAQAAADAISPNLEFAF